MSIDLTKEEILKKLAAGELELDVASKLLFELENMPPHIKEYKNKQRRLNKEKAQERLKQQMLEKEKSAKLSATVVAVAISLIGIAIWWCNYFDHAQKAAHDDFMGAAGTAARSMHRDPPRTNNEAKQILNNRLDQLEIQIQQHDQKSGQ